VLPGPLRLAFLADPNSVHTQRWIGFFASRGHRIELLVGTEDAVSAALPDGVRLHRYPRFGPRRLPVLSSLQGRRALRALLAELRPDVLHAHYISRYGWQARLSGFRPYVVTPWGSDLFVTPRRSLRARLWARWTLRGADLVTVQSEQMERAVLAAGARPDRVQRILFGVDTTRFTPAPADASAAGFEQGDRIVFSPRALRPLYRHDTVVEALAMLPSDVRVVMTGRGADPAYRRRIEAQASSLGLADRIGVIDEIDDDRLIGIYRLAAAVVSVPESDGLPSTVLEAMACGAAAVVSDLPGLRELIAPVAPDLIVPLGDPMLLAAALNRLLGLTPAKRATLAGALRRRIVEVADQRVNMLRMEALYARLAADR
jgi:glycosyltransferase involved in cell wall biosynthesis